LVVVELAQQAKVMLDQIVFLGHLQHLLAALLDLLVVAMVLLVVLGLALLVGVL
jgi:hypothetical protein